MQYTSPVGTQTTDICLPCQIKWQVHTSSALGNVRRWRHEGSPVCPGPAKWFIPGKFRVSCKPEFAICSITCYRGITNILIYFLTCILIMTIDWTQPTNWMIQRQNMILCSEYLQLFSTTCQFLDLTINTLDIRDLFVSAVVGCFHFMAAKDLFWSSLAGRTMPAYVLTLNGAKLSPGTFLTINVEHILTENGFNSLGPSDAYMRR